MTELHDLEKDTDTTGNLMKYEVKTVSDGSGSDNYFKSYHKGMVYHKVGELIRKHDYYFAFSHASPPILSEDESGKTLTTTIYMKEH